MVGDYFSHGKLLLSGEFMILRGARGLALPTSKGQHLKVRTHEDDRLLWTAINSEGDAWFSAELDGVRPLTSTDDKVAARLSAILSAAIEQRPELEGRFNGLAVETVLEFPNNWGLGTSSTLIHNIATWLDVDGFDLLQATLGGSGYDLAVATEGRPIIYELHDGEPFHEVVEWNPRFTDQIHFIHLNTKEDTSAAVSRFLADEEAGYQHLSTISGLTEAMVACTERSEFETIIRKHDELVSKAIGIPSAQEVYSQYSAGVVKYLGAWGGDFMLATGSEGEMDFFRERGLTTIISFNDMIKTL